MEKHESTTKLEASGLNLSVTKGRSAQMNGRCQHEKEDIMRNVILSGVVVCIMIVFAGNAVAQQKGPVEAMAQGVVDTVAKGCEKELIKYCKDVTPGEGRVLACLYAHENKLSARCEYALFDAAAQLDRAISSLTYLANECGDDLEKYCADVPEGQGRLLNCLKKNDKKVSKRCKQALKDTGMK